MYIFKKNIMCILNICICIYNINYDYKYMHVNIFKIYNACVCIYISLINITSTHGFYINKHFYLDGDYSRLII